MSVHISRIKQLLFLICYLIILQLLNNFLISNKAYASDFCDKPFLSTTDNSQESSKIEEDLIVIDCMIRINNVIKGETTVLIKQEVEKEVAFIDPTPIKHLIKKYMNEDAYEICADAMGDERFIKSLKLENNFSVGFNFDDQIVEVLIPVDFIKLQTTSISGKINEIDPNNIVPPAPFSFYVNVYFDKTFNYLENSRFSLKNDPSRFLCDYCFHKEMWTFEGDVDLGAAYYKEQLLSSAILTYDIPQRKLRIGFGNIQPRLIGLEQGVRLMGLSIDSNAGYFEDVLTTCNDRIDFFLNKTSRVEVLINGISCKVIRLPPGPHQLQDFPCLQGSNLVTLKINNDEEDVKVLNASYAYHPSAVQKGVLAYSLGLGFPESWKCNSYLWRAPVIKASCIYGTHSYLSSGGFFQISPYNLQMGTEQILFTMSCRLKLGCAFFWSFHQHPNFQCYLSCDNSISRNNNGFRWNANFYYFGKSIFCDFNRHLPLDDDGLSDRLNTPKLATSFNIARRWLNSYFISAGLSGSVNQQWKTTYGLSASISKNYNQCFSGSLSGFLNFNHRDSNCRGMILTVTTSLPNSSIYNTSSYLSQRGSFYNQSTWSKKFQEHTNLNTSLGVEDSPKQQTLNVDCFLNHNRFTGSTMMNTTKIKKGSQLQSSIYNGIINFSLATCVLYADGCYAISRPNYDSFIIIKPRSEIASNGIQVNNDACSSWGPFPAVLDNQPSYDLISVDVKSEDLPMGYNFGKNDFCFQTEYKSGTALIVGNGKSYLVSGKLVDQEGTPIKCIFGYVKPLHHEPQEKIEFFTNREGEFQIETLKEDLYELHIIGKSSSIQFEITNNNKGFVELGTLVLKKNEAGDG